VLPQVLQEIGLGGPAGARPDKSDPLDDLDHLDES
jgi:hypothetical protein